MRSPILQYRARAASDRCDHHQNPFKRLLFAETSHDDRWAVTRDAILKKSYRGTCGMARREHQRTIAITGDEGRYWADSGRTLRLKSNQGISEGSRLVIQAPAWADQGTSGPIRSLVKRPRALGYRRLRSSDHRVRESIAAHRRALVFGHPICSNAQDRYHAGTTRLRPAGDLADQSPAPDATHAASPSRPIAPSRHAETCGKFPERPHDCSHRLHRSATPNSLQIVFSGHRFLSESWGGVGTCKSHCDGTLPPIWA